MSYRDVLHPDAASSATRTRRDDIEAEVRRCMDIGKGCSRSGLWEFPALEFGRGRACMDTLLIQNAKRQIYRCIGPRQPH